jgi:hypothetical protein
MLLECSCGKTYRVRDGSTSIPSHCPSCGQPLRQILSADPAQDQLIPQFKAQVEALELTISALKKSLALKDSQLAEAKAQLETDQQSLLAEQARSAVALNEVRAELAQARQASEKRIQGLVKQINEDRKEAQRATSLETEISSLLVEMKSARAERDQSVAALGEAEQKTQRLEGELKDQRQWVAALEGRAHSAERDRDTEKRTRELLETRLRDWAPSVAPAQPPEPAPAVPVVLEEIETLPAPPIEAPRAAPGVPAPAPATAFAGAALPSDRIDLGLRGRDEGVPGPQGPSVHLPPTPARPLVRMTPPPPPSPADTPAAVEEAVPDLPPRGSATSSAIGVPETPPPGSDVTPMPEREAAALAMASAQGGEPDEPAKRKSFFSRLFRRS